MFKTLLNEVKEEIVIEKSRFIAHAIPVDSEDEANAYIEKIKKEHWKANHNVPVYVIGQKYDVQRYSDDGEPSGTSGVPVLDMIKREGITNVCIVMTRYFGGIKLGTGGLVRAYTQSAKSVLNDDNLVKVSDFTFMVITFDYTYQGKINHLINSYETYITDQVFSDKVTLHVYVEPSESDIINEKLVELTGDNISIELNHVYGTVLNGDFMEMEAT